MYLRIKHNLKRQKEINRSFSNKTSKTHKNPKTGAVLSNGHIAFETGKLHHGNR
jgi:hypothetical protein